MVFLSRALAFTWHLLYFLGFFWGKTEREGGRKLWWTTLHLVCKRVKCSYDDIVELGPAETTTTKETSRQHNAQFEPSWNLIPVRGHSCLNAPWEYPLFWNCLICLKYLLLQLNCQDGLVSFHLQNIRDYRFESLNLKEWDFHLFCSVKIPWTFIDAVELVSELAICLLA